MRLPDWLYQDVPSDLSGWFLLFLFVATMTWGLTTIAASLRDRNRKDIRVFWKTFRFWLGVFLVWCDGMLYGIVSLGTLRHPDTTELWTTIMTGSWFVVTLIALGLWAREDIESRTKSTR